jgi:SAM-dependent methyltransferase
MAELTDPWANRAYLRDVQYRTDVNLAARQSIYAYQEPWIDLAARAIDLAAPAVGETVVDVGCGNGAYLAELARRGFGGRVLGLDLSPGMLAAARDRLASVGSPARRGGPVGIGDGAPHADLADGAALAVGGAALAAGRISLAVADAAALPLPDGAADLTLAMHMLYHVPDPAQAVRELRRVTRPGGRVVIVLNGADHMRQLRDIVAAERGPQHERLTLADGHALAAPYFSSVTRHDFVSELRIPGPEPIVGYLSSMSGTRHGSHTDGLRAWVVARFPTAPDATFTITTHTGCLICEV